ncbi:MAG TPA: copper resistance protein CopC [Gemmatimonadaceae bacterium]|nr:copper resistance protein CopC [Gemmatimonadaceae bacterium]
MSRVRRVAIVAVIIVASLAGVRGVLYAHAMLVSAEPPADSVVPASPRRVRLLFSEQLEPTLASISLIGGDGRATKLHVAGDPYDVDALIAPIADLAPGAYRVAWHVVSADGHPVGGSYLFWVGRKGGPVPRAGLAESQLVETGWGPSLLAAPMIPALARGIAVGCAMALAGLLVFMTWPGQAADVRGGGLVRALALAAPVFLALHFAAWIVNVSPAHRLTSSALAAAAGSATGKIDLWCLGLSVLALWALWLVRHPRIALVFALAVVLLSGATGHSAAIQPWLAAPARSLHLLAGAVWLGGICWLIAYSRGEGAGFAREASRVSTLALWSVIAVAASGIGMSLLFLSSIGDLVHSGYGAVMLGKVAGLLVLVAFGAYYRARALPRLDGDQTTSASFKAVLQRELVVMTIVVLLGGWLAYVPPPRAPINGSSSIETPIE